MSPNWRLVVSSAIGAIVAAVVARFAPWQLAALAGWCAAALAFLTQVALKIAGCDAARTKEIATRADVSHFVADLTLVSAAAASLVGVGFGLAKASHLHGFVAGATTALSVLSVALAWTTLQTIYLLRYARTYYELGDGIDFGGDAPDYHDFAYIAFTVGMTYQVSDTAITARSIRRLVLRQSLFSFVFATAFIAVLVNVVGGLL